MKLNLSLIKAITVMVVGSSIYSAGSKLNHKSGAIASSITGLSVLAFGMVQTIHEFEKKNKIANLQKQALFWESKASRHSQKNKEYLQELQELKKRIHTLESPNSSKSSDLKLDEEYFRKLEKAEMN